MSVLSFPRIYFKGYMAWDPCTFNNNDWTQFPTYQPINSALNWSFLSSQGITPDNPQGITPDNFTTTFRPWAIALQGDSVDQPSGARIPAEWNMFGTHGVSFVQYDKYTTTIIGGDTEYQKPVTSDPIIGGKVSIAGDGGGGQGRLVDTNPASPWSSQIYFGQLGFGSGANSSFSGPRAFRMHSRWLNPSRIYNPTPMLTAPASRIGVCFQTCIPYGQVAWPAASASPLITKLQQAAAQPGARGIMVRFAAYVNLYFMNGILNGTAAQPRTYEDLAALLKTAWDAWNNNKDHSKFFSNPCYSHVVGAVGVWNDGELASAPGGRCLAPNAPVVPLNASAAQGTAAAQPVRLSGHEVRTVAAAADAPAAVPLGPAAANLTDNLISLDFNAAVPELGVAGPWRSSLVKADFGPLAVGVMTNGNFISIVTIDSAKYQQSAYEASAGIIDIPLPSGAADLLRNGALAIQAQGQTVLLEQTYTAETDTRGIYLDQNGQAQFTVLVCKGGVPSPGTSVLIAQYDSGLNLAPANLPPSVAFTTGVLTSVTIPSDAPTITTNVAIVTTDASGNATVGISAQSPGFPVLAFFPFSGGTLPQPPISFDFTDDAFYTTVRVLPFDDAVPQAFVDLWNKSHDQAQAWNFIYFQILYVYDMLFNVMLPIVNLGSKQAVEGSRRGIWRLIAKEKAAESTEAMPITRDMSAGKRLALQLWIYLVANSYNVPNFNVNSIPSGWSPK
jgi:hypothetical protein